MKLFLAVCGLVLSVTSQEIEKGVNSLGDYDYDENHKDGTGDGILDDIKKTLFGEDQGNLTTFPSDIDATSDNPIDPVLNTTNSGTDLEADASANGTWSGWETLWITRPCNDWMPLNHYFFHLANVFLLLSYLAPNNIYGLLYLRVTLAIGCAFFSIWGWAVLCAFDTFLWNIIFVAINLIHICILLWYLKPVHLPKELNEVYETLFKPLKVSKQQFKKTISCIKDVREIPFQGNHAQEKLTPVETLSLLLSGRMIVSQKGRALHLITRNQFLDSPEWFGTSTDDCFQVTITALEDCRVLVWRRDKLRLVLLSDPFLHAVFDHVLGRDVVKKLTQVQDAILAMTGDWMPLEKTDMDEKQALLAKQIDDGPQIVAMLNKSSHGLFWNTKLPYIDEGEV